MVRHVANFFGLTIVKIHCDVCDEILDEKSWDYMCWTCANYDLCEVCYKSKKNRHGHEFHKQLVGGKFSTDSKTVCQFLCDAFVHYATRPAIGWRIKKKDKFENNFTWVTYEELKTMADTFARGLMEIGLKKNEIVGISGPNRLEWFVADLATIFCKALTVPIHTTYDEKVVEFIIQQTELKIIICTSDLIEKDSCPQWQILICMDNVKEKDLPAKFKRLKYYTHADIMKLGKKSQMKPHEVPDQTESDLFTINYTSGSTGMPKGVMHSNGAYFSGLTRFSDTMAVTLSYEPMAHSTRQNDIRFLVTGGRIGLISELKNLFEDCQLLNPSMMAGVPRVWNKLYSEFNEALSKATEGQPKEKYRQIERHVLQQFGKLLGNRLGMLSVGGAPPSKAILNFLRRCFRCIVVDGYGITEVGGVTTDNKVDNTNEVKLVDWNEYKTTDKTPRGEILVRNRRMALGYYKNEQATAEAFKDGWFHTGDIGEYTKNGLKIIGRKKQIFKLAQGEYVSPERLENIFQKSEFIDQIFVHGDSYQSYLVAVIVVNSGIIAHWAKAKGVDASNIDKLCTSNELFEQIMFEIVKYATIEKLLPYEIPRNYHLTTEKFTIENKRMTSSDKICRPQLETDYKQLLVELYKQAEGATEDKLLLTDANIARLMTNFTQETVNKVLSDTLNLPKGSAKQSFVQLGGDSLSAVKFVNLLNNALSIKIQPEDVFKNDNLDDFAKLVKDRWEQNQLISAEPSNNNNVNTNNTNVNNNNDSNDHEKNSADPEKNSHAVIEPTVSEFSAGSIKLDESMEIADPKTCVTDPKKAMLTGVTGILGVFFLAELMEQTKYTIYCLVRDLTGLGKNAVEFDDSKAMARIKSALTRAELWKDEFSQRIIPIAGDLSRPLLGLSESRFAALSGEIDVIYHNGAAVNSLQTYAYHYAPNVRGTHEVIRLAFMKKVKPLHYISTLSVFENIGVGRWFRENTPIGQVNCPESAYGRSKYEAELLCEQARTKGLPVTIYRPGAVSGHSKTGYLKETDFINRLLIGVIHMAAYPKSLASSHVEYTAVDYVTRAIVYLSLCNSLKPAGFKEWCQCYHLTSPPVLYAKIFDAITRYGYSLAEVEHTEVWAADLSDMPENLLYPYLDSFSRSVVPYSKEVNDYTTKQALKGSDITCPPVDEALIHAYLTFMKKNKLIPSVENQKM